MNDRTPPSTSRKIASDDDLFRFGRCLSFLERHAGPIAPGTIWLDLGCHQCQLLRLLVRDRSIRAAASTIGTKRASYRHLKAPLDIAKPTSSASRLGRARCR